MNLIKSLNKKTLLLIAVAAVALIVIVAIVISSLGKTTKSGAEEAVENSVLALKEGWVKVYDDIDELFSNGTYRAPGPENRLLEIRGARVISILPNENDLYKNVSYLVEFELYSNRFRAEPYYLSEDIYNTVLVYADGRCELLLRNPIGSSVEQFEGDTIHSLIGEIKVFEDEFDQKITIK